MKKSLIKNNFKEIIKTRRRFISILIMAFLGVGFYSGLTASSPDMLESLDNYTDTNKMYDINIISTLGLTDKDIQELQKIEEIENVYGLQTKDTIAKLDNKENVCKIIEYNENINIPTVVAGRMPSNINECLLDENYTLGNDKNSFIGKKIILENEEKNENDAPIFTQKELTIVGIANTPIYISNERGNTTLGNGSVKYFIYAKDDIINIDYYTEIGITVKNAKKQITNSDKYLKIVNPVIKKIEEIKEERENERYNSLINEANQKLNDAQSEYDAQKQEIDRELQDAENQLINAQNEIINSENKIKKAEKELANQESNTKSQLDNAKKQIQNAETQIKSKETDLNNAKSQFESKKSEAQAGIAQIETAISNTQTNLETLENQKKELEEAGITDHAIDALIYQAQTAILNLNNQKNEILNMLSSSENEIKIGETQLNQGKTELESQKNALYSNEKTAYNKIATAKAEIASGKKQIETGKAELSEKQQEFENSKAEAYTKLEEAQTEINNSRDKISQIEKATWYIKDRYDNIGYSNIFDAIKTMSNISKLFPIIFYIVAVLISLTSMTRMIEEERIEIGTLKSLGYTNFQIISKYILYSFLACTIGGILGMSIGFYLLPSIVWNLYSTIYTIPDFKLIYQLHIGLIGTLIAFICIGGATILVAYKELKEMPAVLMRPKAPKSGKKIFLEKINFIWKRFNFSQKITIRNIFRYKKRAIMTIVGIAGCTGLMVTGFGIKDSIIDIPSSQYGKIFTYDSTITLANTNNLKATEEYLSNNENVQSYSKICANTGKVKTIGKSYDVTIFSPESAEDFKTVCNLIDSETGKKLELTDEGIIITDKLSEFLEVKVGDTVTLIDGENIEHKLKISGIAENYVTNYIYTTQNYYNSNIKTFKTNMILLKAIDNISSKNLNIISEELLKIDGIAAVSVVSTLMSAISDMLETLNYVVIILVVASALLAFVVLYNLANINIGERLREIATLKVLGFYDKEVDNYINKENVVFTTIGILIGLIFGYFLTNGVVASVEIDKLKFIKHIQPISYIYSALITIIFSFIVNKVIHFVLKKINMIESLKSVE